MSIKFSKYDSAVFPTIEESIEHAKTNPFLSKNFAGKIRVKYKDTEYIIMEPSPSIKMFLNSLSEFFIEDVIRDEENYSPESTALRLYGSHDFWFLVMLLNSFDSITSYKKGNSILVIPPEQLFRIEKFLVRHTSPIQEISDTSIIYR